MINKKFKKELNVTPDEKRILRMMDDFFAFNQSFADGKGTEDFCGDLKFHSSFKGKQKDEHKEHVTKEDIYPLIRHCFDVAEPERFIPVRELKRAGYSYKNDMLTYLAYFYPDVMENISESFKNFEFYTKLYDVDILVFKWKQKIKRIQALKNQLAGNRSITLLTPLPSDKINQENSVSNQVSSINNQESSHSIQEDLIFQDKIGVDDTFYDFSSNNDYDDLFFADEINIFEDLDF